MGITSLTINGADRTALVQPMTLHITDQLNTRNRCQWSMVDPTGNTALAPHAGEPVVATWDYGTGPVVLFAGTVDDVRQTKRNTLPHLWYDVNALDFNQLCDRRLVIKEYTNQTLQAIVADLVTDYLAEDGVTLDAAMETGPTIEHAIFNYRAVSDVLRDLTDLTGFTWYIDYSRVLHVASRAFFLAPFSLTSTLLYRTISVTETREQYRNQQWIKAGVDIADPSTESMKGDGAMRTFTVALPIALVPTVRVNGVLKTVGILNVDTLKDWYWNVGEATVTQDDGGTLLTSGDILAVTYQGQFPILVQNRDQGAVTERATVEGGSGLYEAIEDHSEITRGSLAKDFAAGLLRRYARIPHQLDIETDEVGLRAGQLITVTMPDMGLDGEYLIETAEIKDLTGAKLRYNLTVLDGEPFGTFQAFFRNLAGTRKVIIGENEVLLFVRSTFEGATIGEPSYSATSQAARGAAVGDQVGLCEVGA